MACHINLKAATKPVANNVSACTITSKLYPALPSKEWNNSATGHNHFLNSTAVNSVVLFAAEQGFCVGFLR